MTPRAAACRALLPLLLAALAPADEPAAAPDGMIRSLAADGFQERERAARELAEWAVGHPEQARERFFREAADNEDPEVRMRCRELLRQVVLSDFRRTGNGYVGISMGREDVPNDLDGGGFGVRVMQVMPETPAEEAGLLAGDVIFEIDGKRWHQPGASDHFQAEIMARRPGEFVRLGLRRAGEPALIERRVKLARRPPIPDMAQLFLLPGQQQLDPARLQREEEERFFKQWYERRLTEHRAAPR